MKINGEQQDCYEIWNYVNTKIKDFYVRTEEDLEKLVIKTTPKEILELSSSSTFGKMETEISARWVLRFLANRDNTFLPFKFSELQKYYVENLKKKEEFRFNGLEYGNPNKNIKPEISKEKGMIYLSQRFIIFTSINNKNLSI